MRLYRYVGPEAIRVAHLSSPRGERVAGTGDLVSFSNAHAADAGTDGLWVTYVVSDRGELLVAPRRSEHVACAGGEPVAAAGELCIDPAGRVVAASNLSTGYCPEPSSWTALEAALDRAGIAHPGRFTYEAIFRRCTSCGERNLVKDGWFVCGVCGAEVPDTWNFA